METKVCEHCTEEVLIEDFPLKNKEVCKKCRCAIAQKKHYEKNKEKRNEYNRLYCKQNKEKINKTKTEHRKRNKEKINKKSCAYHKKYKANNREKIKESGRLYYEKNKEKIREKHRLHHEKNKEKINEKKKKYRQENKEKVVQKRRLNENKRRATDPAFKVSKIISNAIYETLKTKGSSKNGRKWEKLLGYTRDDLKIHLESKFTSDMTWENYGSYWHIDHIIPKSWFNYSCAEDESFKTCWSLSNLQPLIAKENLRKNNRWAG